jgi:hypothetical protein
MQKLRVLGKPTNKMRAQMAASKLINTDSFASVGNYNGTVSRRIQSTKFQIASGSNPAIAIQQPGNMALLAGVNLYINTTAAIADTVISLIINGLKYLDNVSAQELIPSNNYHPKGLLFVPISAPLAGNDSIQLEVTGGGTSTCYFTIYYKSIPNVENAYLW